MSTTIFEDGTVISRTMYGDREYVSVFLSPSVSQDPEVQAKMKELVELVARKEGEKKA